MCSSCIWACVQRSDVAFEKVGIYICSCYVMTVRVLGLGCQTRIICIKLCEDGCKHLIYWRLGGFWRVENVVLMRSAEFRLCAPLVRRTDTFERHRNVFKAYWLVPMHISQVSNILFWMNKWTSRFLHDVKICILYKYTKYSNIWSVKIQIALSNIVQKSKRKIPRRQKSYLYHCPCRL